MPLNISRSSAGFFIASIVGAVLIWICWFENDHVIRSRSFVSATAILKVVHHEPGRGKSGRPFFYEGTLVDSGIQFRSHRVSYGNINSDETYSEVVASYPTGKPVEVLIPPDGGSEVILKRGNLSWVFIAFLASGVILLIAGLTGLVRVFRIRAKSP